MTGTTTPTTEDRLDAPVASLSDSPRHPLSISLRPAPAMYQDETATCPACEGTREAVIGRIGLRLVFQCGRCRVLFYRGNSLARP
jgi:hypothetical protein